MKKTIGIVGTGISGMTCAHYLKSRYDITLFDKNDRVGGHTHTHRMGGFTLDTGFIVFNLETYKTMLGLFKDLGVAKQKSEMSFSVYNLKTGLQYSGSNLLSLFAQKRNIFSIRYWRFLREIDRFFKIARVDHRRIQGSEETIKMYCRRNGLSDYFIDNYLVPMSSAVWSTPTEKMRDFPIALLLPFFFNHGLLGVNQQFQWYTVKGGSDTYTQKIAAGLEIHTDEEVLSAVENRSGVRVRTKKRVYDFDAVILASHADESLKIAKGIPKEKKGLLEKFTYVPNIAVLHTDSGIMPPERKVWSSWNHVIFGSKASTIYWLNKLQRPDTDMDYFLSINPFQKIRESKVIKEIRYDHPLFTVDNFAIQNRLVELNQDTKIFFAGSYFGYGFHEDGCKSGRKVVECLL